MEKPSTSDSDARWLAAKSPFYWEFHADGLERASKLLCSRYEAALKKFQQESDARGTELVIDAFNPDSWLLSISLMLMGLAVEVNLKAAARLSKDPIEKHDLVKLARDVDMSLTKRQCTLLVHLQSYIEWRGRYPSPKAHRRATTDLNGPLSLDDMPELTKLVRDIKKFMQQKHCDSMQGTDWDVFG